MLVAVTLLSTVGMVVLAALGASASSALTSREVAEAEAALATAGDRISAVDHEVDEYVPCAVASDYADLVSSVDGVSVALVEYWTGSGWTTSSCEFAAGERLQRITLQASAGSINREAQILKRPAVDPASGLAPLTAINADDLEFVFTPGAAGPGSEGSVADG